MSKIIFLDIDGVLCVPKENNYVNRIILKGHSFGDFHPDCVANLNKITNVTNAKIVISSAWRIDFWEPDDFEILKEYFKLKGASGEIIDHTPYDHSSIRGREIQTWLNGHSDVEQFVIIDDSNDMEHLLPKLIRTKFHDGIEEEHANKAIEILNK